VSDPRSQFRNNASQATKGEMLRQDKLNNTLYGRGLLELEQSNTGRFARLKSSKSPLPEYPPLPETSPWHHDPVGQEAPLGFSVENVAFCGDTVVELIASVESIPDVGARPETEAPSASSPAHVLSPSPVPQNPKLLRRPLR